MRVVFMGTPDFAVASLQALAEAGHELIAVVTRPDRPRGRGRINTPTPVKVAARALGLPVLQPLRIKDPEFIGTLGGLAPEVVVVVAYGQILPVEILSLPPLGCINVHASLLPEYRGAAPIHWAVINGEKETGVTTIYMDEGMDTGDLILKKSIPIQETDTVGAVHDRLALAGSRLLVETLRLIRLGKAPRIPQTGKPSYAPLLKAEDEQICWSKPAREIYNHVRGMNPWPGARTTLQGRVLKLWRTSCPAQGWVGARPGEIVAAGRQGIMVGTGKGMLSIQELQLQGGKRLEAAALLRGNPIPAGTVLGSDNLAGGEGC
jgi:methionyl-tRNA formyltransferase